MPKLDICIGVEELSPTKIFNPLDEAPLFLVDMLLVEQGHQLSLKNGLEVLFNQQ